MHRIPGGNVIRFVTGPLFAAALLAAVPAAAQVTQPPAMTEAQTEAMATWLTRVSEAMAMGNEGAQALAEAKPLLATIRSPADARAVVPRVRAIIAEAREKAVQADAALAAMSSPDIDLGGGLTPRQIVADGREQNGKVLALLTDFDAFVLAMEKGDRATGDRLAPKVMSGAFLLIDSNRLLIRNRQALLPSSDSTHQALGILGQIYRGMSSSSRAWLRSRGGPQEAEAARLRTELSALSQEVRKLAATGRANLARDLAEVETASRRKNLSPAEAAEMAAMRKIFDEEAKVFALAEEVAAASERHSATTAAALAGQQGPALLAELSPLEVRFHAITASQAEIASSAMR